MLQSVQEIPQFSLERWRGQQRRIRKAMIAENPRYSEITLRFASPATRKRSFLKEACRLGFRIEMCIENALGPRRRDFRLKTPGERKFFMDNWKDVIFFLIDSTKYLNHLAKKRSELANRRGQSSFFNSIRTLLEKIFSTQEYFASKPQQFWKETCWYSFQIKKKKKKETYEILFNIIYSFELTGSSSIVRSEDSLFRGKRHY